MAIYKGRSVTVNPDDLLTLTPQTVSVVHEADGRNEHAKVSDILFTKEEKAKLSNIKNIAIDNLQEISDKEIKLLKGTAKAGPVTEADILNPKKTEEELKKEKADAQASQPVKSTSTQGVNANPFARVK